MRKFIAIVLMLFFLMGANASMVFGASEGFGYKTIRAGNGYVTRFYDGNKCVGKIRTNKRLAVKVIKSEKLTIRQLENRRGKYILVEVINGKCLDSRGNGKTSDGYYISYGNVNNHRKNAKYRTYCIYGNNNYIDDVIARADFRIN